MFDLLRAHLAEQGHGAVCSRPESIQTKPSNTKGLFRPFMFLPVCFLKRKVMVFLKQLGPLYLYYGGSTVCHQVSGRSWISFCQTALRHLSGKNREVGGWLQWQIFKGLQTDAGRCWLWPFKLCWVFYCTAADNQVSKEQRNSGACTVLRSGLNESSVLPTSSIISQIQQIHYIESIKDIGYYLSSAGKVWQQ